MLDRVRWRFQDSESRGRTAKFAAEHPAEMGQMIEADLKARGRHAGTLAQKAGCGLQADAKKVPMGRHAGEFREDVREVIGRHPRRPSDLGQRMLAAECRFQNRPGFVDAACILSYLLY